MSAFNRPFKRRADFQKSRTRLKAIHTTGRSTFDVHDQITIATKQQASICPSCESPMTHSRLATIIMNVSMTFENLPVVWMAYCRRFTWRADRRLPLGCYGNLIVNIKRGQSRPKRACGSTPQTRLGHVHVHDYRRGTFLLYLNDKRIVVFLKRVGSFLSILYKWLISMPASRPAQSWGICAWTDPLTIGYGYHKRVRDLWKPARHVNGLLR